VERPGVGTVATADTLDGVTVAVALTVLDGTVAVAATRDGVIVVGAVVAKLATRYERSVLVFVWDMVTEPADTPFL